MRTMSWKWIGLMGAVMAALAGCGGGGGATQSGGTGGGGSLSGTISADGSSTVGPITEAVAEEFRKQNSGVMVTVGTSGTGGGFKKFGAGEIDIADASRPIKKSEEEEATKQGIQYVELPVAYDALSIVVNPKNTWAQDITVAELKKIWEPSAQGKIMRWSQVRAGWPDQPLKLYGPGTDSGTFDYFTEAVVGESKASRGDYTASEDDNVLVQGVSRDVNALGYFGLSYYSQNQQSLKALPVDDGNAENGAGPQAPTAENVAAGTYQPLARPIFIYVSSKAVDRAEVKAFIDFYMSNAANLVTEVGYVPLQPEVYTAARTRFTNKTMGSVFSEGTQVGVKLEDLLKKETAAQ